MSLAPLLNASPVIQLHAFAAMGAFALGIVQLSAPKGTIPHRTLGWIWVVLMLVVAGSSFWIHDIRMFGPFSLIHALSIFTLTAVPIAVLAARRHQVIRASLLDDRDIRRRADHRRILHLCARAHHAQRWPSATERRKTAKNRPENGIRVGLLEIAMQPIEVPEQNTTCKRPFPVAFSVLVG